MNINLKWFSSRAHSLLAEIYLKKNYRESLLLNSIEYNLYSEKDSSENAF